MKETMKMESNEMKARFCQQYFTTMLTMVNRCDVSGDDFGLRFLCEALPEESRHEVGWQLPENDRVQEEHLMLGVEEFWTMTDSACCKSHRDVLVRGLLGNDFSEKHLQDIGVGCLIEEILHHFGDIPYGELQEVDSAIKEFMKCVELFKLQVPLRYVAESGRAHRYCAFALYSLIGLVTLLRRAWKSDVEGRLSSKYAAPDHFEMPDQSVSVCVRLEQPKQAGALHFFGGTLTYTLKAKKYLPFTVEVSFGKDKYLKREVHFNAMLTYYCWHTHVDVVIPKSYETTPLRVKLYEKKADM